MELKADTNLDEKAEASASGKCAVVAELELTHSRRMDRLERSRPAAQDIALSSTREKQKR